MASNIYTWREAWIEVSMLMEKLWILVKVEAVQTSET